MMSERQLMFKGQYSKSQSSISHTSLVLSFTLIFFTVSFILPLYLKWPLMNVILGTLQSADNATEFKCKLQEEWSNVKKISHNIFHYKKKENFTPR